MDDDAFIVSLVLLSLLIVALLVVILIVLLYKRGYRCCKRQKDKKMLIFQALNYGISDQVDKTETANPYVIEDETDNAVIYAEAENGETVAGSSVPNSISTYDYAQVPRLNIDSRNVANDDQSKQQEPIQEVYAVVHKKSKLPQVTKSKDTEKLDSDPSKEDNISANGDVYAVVEKSPCQAHEVDIVENELYGAVE